MAGRIIASFKSKKNADKATRALKDAGIEPGADTPENGGAPVVIAPLPAGVATSSLNNVGPLAVPATVGDDNIEKSSKKSGETIISVSVRDDAEADKVMAIVNDYGGTVQNSDENAKSTLDEVANPAQARDRLQ